MSWAYFQAWFEEEEDILRCDGFGSADDLHKAHIFEPIKTMMGEQTPNAIVIAAHMVRLPFAFNEESLDGFEPKVLSLLRNTSQRSVLFEALCSKRADDEADQKLVERYKETMALSPEEEALLKLDLLVDIEIICNLYERSAESEAAYNDLLSLAKRFVGVARVYDQVFTTNSNPYIHAYIGERVDETLPLCASALGISVDNILESEEESEGWYPDVEPP